VTEPEFPQDFLLFTAPEKVQVITRLLPAPNAEEVLVHVTRSAISTGTELLIYRGQFPPEESLDQSIKSLPGSFTYPFQYGYSTVGVVAAAGSESDQEWVGRRVFAFQPHASAYLSLPNQLISLPADISAEDTLFLPNMETAVNFVQDGAPLIGERVAVIGLGIVGLLTANLLARFPLSTLDGIDLLPGRCSIAAGLPGVNSFSPEKAAINRPDEGYDLIFELSGSPEGLNLAINLAGFESRIVIGSWYGTKKGEINLGGKFHRNRIKLVSSQVSTIASHLQGRWSKQRRLETVIDQLTTINPSKWISHRFRLSRAQEAYELLSAKPDEAFQVVFSYDNDR